MSITAFNAIVSRPWDDPPVYILPNQANYKEILPWVHEDQGETLTVATFSDILEEQPALLKALATAPAGVMIDSRSVFDQWCKTHGYSQNDANWKLVEDYVPFYEHRLLVSLERGQLGLAKATEAEKNAIEAERAAQVEEQRQRQLLNATPAELKQVIRNEAEQRALTAREEQDRQHMEAVTARDSQKGYEPLPTIWQGRALDAHFIKNAPAAVLRNLLKRYGSAQLDARLRGQ